MSGANRRIKNSASGLVYNSAINPSTSSISTIVNNLCAQFSTIDSSIISNVYTLNALNYQFKQGKFCNHPGMGATVFFLVKAGRLMGTDNTGFNNALKGRIASQAATVIFIMVGAWSLKRKSYNQQIENELITG